MPGTNKRDRITNSAQTIPLQVRLRLEHAGRWVGWSEDGRRIVASGEDFDAVREEGRQAGGESVIYEWLPPLEGARSSGGL